MRHFVPLAELSATDSWIEFISLQSLWWLVLVGLVLAGLKFSLVDQPFWKRFVSVFFRSLAIALLIAALCRPFMFTHSTAKHLVFLVDVSQSVDLEASEEAVKQIKDGIEALADADSYSLYAFGNGLKKFDNQEQFESWVHELTEGSFDDRFRSQSKLSDALLAVRLDFPADKSKRIVAFSDGQDTTQTLAETVRQLQEEQIDLRLNKVQSLTHAEAAVDSVVPTTEHAFIGEVVRMSVSVSSNSSTKARLRLVHRGVAVQQQEIQLNADKPNRFWFDVDMVTPGESRWSVELVPEDDYFAINNSRTCTVSVQGKPRVLFVHRQPAEVRTILRALEGQNFVVESRGEFGLPTTMEGMLSFDAIVLADIPATSMSTSQMGLLSRYVKDFGGGLAMLGSENSFGLGGYHKTPVEEVVPLVSRFEKEKEKPSLAMVLVIDKSGSMDGVPIALARQAAKSAADLLSVRDQIAVVGFDSSPVIVSEMRSAGQIDEIHAGIDSLVADGGTDMYPAMVIAKDMLESTNAKIRHMICLGDGMTPAADFTSLTQRLTDRGITVSTVALGEADRSLLSTIAELGKGRFYETNDPANVPQIFARETMQASQSAIKEDLYGSVQTGDHPILAGFQESDLPFTLGFVMTQAKPTAQLLLVTETGDPLLAISKYGLGSGLAFTSDLSEKWGGEWLAWGDCGKFWGQVFRGIVRKRDTSGMTIQSKVAGDQWVIDVRRTDEASNPVANAQWDIGLAAGEGSIEQQTVREVGLGRYQVQVPIESSQHMTLRLRELDADKMAVLHLDPPYPAEYSLRKKMPESLQAVRSISVSEIGEELQPKPIRQSVAEYFSLAAMVSLLIGNLIRRL